MNEFITDVERQYDLYCKIAEEHGFIDLNAKKNGFRCTTKSNEFNAGWIAFVGAVAAVRDEQQAIIDDLKAQLNNMEACYIGKKKECEGLHGKAQKALQEVSGASCFVNKDSAKDFDFLQGAVLRSYSRIEEALRGGHDSLTDARQKAEDQINNGARLTKHQIDL